MTRAIIIIMIPILLQACSARNIVEGVNAGKRLGSLTQAGVTEEIVNVVRDCMDPVNRGNRYCK